METDNNPTDASCEWPTGCRATADFRGLSFRACYVHHIKPPQHWRIAMLQADAAGIDWRAPLRRQATSGVA